MGWWEKHSRGPDDLEDALSACSCPSCRLCLAGCKPGPHAGGAHVVAQPLGCTGSEVPHRFFSHTVLQSDVGAFGIQLLQKHAEGFSVYMSVRMSLCLPISVRGMCRARVRRTEPATGRQHEKKGAAKGS